MKIKILLLFLFCSITTFGQKNRLKAPQGVFIRLFWKAGNVMPSPDLLKTEGTAKGQPVVREVYVYALTNQKQTEAEGSFYSKINTALIAKIKTNKQGQAWLKLPVGFYSLFIKEDKGLYANTFDDAVNINVIEIKAKQWAKMEIVIDYAAFY